MAVLVVLFCDVLLLTDANVLAVGMLAVTRLFIVELEVCIIADRIAGALCDSICLGT